MAISGLRSRRQLDISSRPEDRQGLVCRELTPKALYLYATGLGHHVYVLIAAATQAHQDDLLRP